MSRRRGRPAHPEVGPDQAPPTPPLRPVLAGEDELEGELGRQRRAGTRGVVLKLRYKQHRPIRSAAASRGTPSGSTGVRSTGGSPAGSGSPPATNSGTAAGGGTRATANESTGKAAGGRTRFGTAATSRRHLRAQVRRHLRYLGRDGAAVDADGEPRRAEFFDATRDAVPRPEVVDRLEPWLREARHWRAILSPGDALPTLAADADRDETLRELTRRWAARVGREAGGRLEWVAVVHRDTDHPHVHLLVRGSKEIERRRRRPLTFQRDEVKHGLRRVAEEVAGQLAAETWPRLRDRAEHTSADVPVTGVRTRDRQVRAEAEHDPAEREATL